jgi:hypothetical protein
MTISLMQLWLPIVLGGIFCWIASAMIHIFIKYHNADYKKLSNEEQVSDAIRQGDPKPGLYHMPFCTDMKEMNNQSMQDKFKQGPIALISVFENGMPPMGKLLAQQLAFFLGGCILIAYVATLAITASADLMVVFRFTMVISFITFGYGLIPNSIWLGQPWSNCLRYLLDALIYAVIIAATFAWLWPVTV